MPNGRVRFYTSSSGVHGAGGCRCSRDVVNGVNGVRDVAQTLLKRPLEVAFGTPPALPRGGTRASVLLKDRWWWNGLD